MNKHRIPKNSFLLESKSATCRTILRIFKVYQYIEKHPYTNPTAIIQHTKIPQTGLYRIILELEKLDYIQSMQVMTKRNNQRYPEKNYHVTTKQFII